MNQAEGLSGLQEFAATMNNLADAVTVKIARRAVEQASIVTASWVNARAPRGATLALSRAVAFVVRVYPDDNAVAGVVGFDMNAPAPRPPSKTKGAEGSKPPFLYAEWVEHGHYVRTRKTKKFKTREGGERSGVSSVAPHPFFLSAIEAARPQAMEAMRREYTEGIARELARNAKP